MSLTDNPANLRQQARTIASGKSARVAWSELKNWASGKGPIAMKSAADEFIAIHGRSPEAAILIPEVLQMASWGTERQGSLIGPRPSPMFGRPAVAQFNPTVPKEMPSLSNFFRPVPKGGMPQLGVVSPLDAQRDPIYLKDEQFRMRGASLSMAKSLPSLPSAPQKTFDASKNPDSFHMGAQNSHGGEILRNLVQKMRTHGQGDFTKSYSMPMGDIPASKPGASRAARPKAPKSKVSKHAVSRKKTPRQKTIRKRVASKPSRNPKHATPTKRLLRMAASKTTWKRMASKSAKKNIVPAKKTSMTKPSLRMAASKKTRFRKTAKPAVIRSKAKHPAKHHAKKIRKSVRG